MNGKTMLCVLAGVGIGLGLAALFAPNKTQQVVILPPQPQPAPQPQLTNGEPLLLNSPKQPQRRIGFA